MSEGLRYERLLPVACLLGAGLLIASEFMDTFRFDAVDVVNGTVAAVATVGDRHQYAMLVLGLFAILALVLAIGSGSKPAAVAVAVAGAVAVLLFVLIDVPDAGKVGTFSDAGQSFVDAKAIPQGGFWLELIGALVLAVCGGALATLDSGQLRALRPGRRGDSGAPSDAGGADRREAGDGAAANSGSEADRNMGPRRRIRRRFGRASEEAG